MRRSRLGEALGIILEGGGWYNGSGDWIEGCMHELVHAVIVGRGVIRKHFEYKIDSMHEGWQNRHEVAVMATQLVALRKLGFKQGIRSASEAVAASIRNNGSRPTRYETVADCRRAILAHKVNLKHVDRVVEIVRTAEKILAR